MHSKHVTAKYARLEQYQPRPKWRIAVGMAAKGLLALTLAALLGAVYGGLLGAL